MYYAVSSYVLTETKDSNSSLATKTTHRVLELATIRPGFGMSEMANDEGPSMCFLEFAQEAQHLPRVPGDTYSFANDAESSTFTISTAQKAPCVIGVDKQPTNWR